MEQGALTGDSHPAFLSSLPEFCAGTLRNCPQSFSAALGASTSFCFVLIRAVALMIRHFLMDLGVILVLIFGVFFLLPDFGNEG